MFLEEIKWDDFKVLLDSGNWQYLDFVVNANRHVYAIQNNVKVLCKIPIVEGCSICADWTENYAAQSNQQLVNKVTIIS